MFIRDVQGGTMGHIRLGTLPGTQKWDRVVSLIAGGADVCDSQPQRHENQRILAKQTSSPGLILPDDDTGADGHAAIEVSDIVIH